MSVFSLDGRILFPDPELADEDGLLAIGGDLSIERLLAAYSLGIFPWFIEDKLPFWFSPDPRCVLFPKDLHVSHSMKQFIKKDFFAVTFDKDFAFVIKSCAKAKRKEDNAASWIDRDFQKAYILLHKKGYAHSVEVWKENKIVGGLYGVSLGKCFFGESMFSTESNASKFGFIYLVEQLKKHGFSLIDCQIYNPHLESLGAIEISRKVFLKELKKGLRHETVIGNWGEFL